MCILLPRDSAHARRVRGCRRFAVAGRRDSPWSRYDTKRGGVSQIEENSSTDVDLPHRGTNCVVCHHREKWPTRRTLRHDAQGAGMTAEATAVHFRSVKMQEVVRFRVRPGEFLHPARRRSQASGGR